MKIIRCIGWTSVGVGVLIIILAVVSFCTGKLILNVSHGSTYFVAASSFLLLAIALFIASKHCCCDSCKCQEEKKES
jgi:hypothetical protein